MPDPRAATNFIGIGYSAYTWQHDGTITYDPEVQGGSPQAGLCVTITGPGEVSLVGAGEMVEGVITKVEDDGFCVVQNGGVVVLQGGAAASLVEGQKIVGAVGGTGGTEEGYIASVATASGVSRGIVLDASDPTAVVVRLESGGPN